MKKAKRKYRRKVDRGMKGSGEIDFEKKTIRVNPKKEELLDTIIHEETHRKNPKKKEKWVKKKTDKVEKKLTIRKAINLLEKYKKKKKPKKKRTSHYRKD